LNPIPFRIRALFPAAIDLIIDARVLAGSGQYPFPDDHMPPDDDEAAN
jgi:hypothetical protein